MPKVCESCGSRYDALRQTARYCSGKCRKRAQRSGLARPAADRASQPPAAAPTSATRGRLTAAVLRELQDAGRDESALGLACLIAAERLDFSSLESGSALAALNRDFRLAYAAALEKTEATGDVLDELAKARADRIARAGGG